MSWFFQHPINIYFLLEFHDIDYKELSSSWEQWDEQFLFIMASLYEVILCIFRVADCCLSNCSLVFFQFLTLAAKNFPVTTPKTVPSQVPTTRNLIRPMFSAFTHLPDGEKKEFRYISLTLTYICHMNHRESKNLVNDSWTFLCLAFGFKQFHYSHKTWPHRDV